MVGGAEGSARAAEHRKFLRTTRTTRGKKTKQHCTGADTNEGLDQMEKITRYAVRWRRDGRGTCFRESRSSCGWSGADDILDGQQRSASLDTKVQYNDPNSNNKEHNTHPCGRYLSECLDAWFVRRQIGCLTLSVCRGSRGKQGYLGFADSRILAWQPLPSTCTYLSWLRGVL